MSTNDDMVKLYIEKENKRNFLFRMFRDQSVTISHVVFQLSVEDVVNVLVDMWSDGCFVPEDVDFPVSMVSDVTENLEYMLDWHSVMVWAINEYLSSVREERKLSGTGQGGPC